MRSTVLLRDTDNWGNGIPGLTGDELCLPLTRGYLSLIDAEDESFSSHSWWALLSTKAQVYAVRNSLSDEHGKRKKILLHREISKPLPVEDVDHKDQHKLFCYKIVDNRRSNLRNVTTSQNLANQRKTRGTSRYKGVSWYKRDEKWQALIQVNRRGIHLGFFVNETEAALAYNQAHQHHFPGIQEGINRIDL